jgi:hypothetical protein
MITTDVAKIKLETKNQMFLCYEITTLNANEEASTTNKTVLL